MCDLIDSRIAKQPDHPTANLDVEAFLQKARAKMSRKPRKPVASDARGLIEEYVGVYGDHAYGNIEISIDDGTQGLIMTYGRNQYV